MGPSDGKEAGGSVTYGPGLGPDGTRGVGKGKEAGTSPGARAWAPHGRSLQQDQDRETRSRRRRRPSGGAVGCPGSSRVHGPTPLQTEGSCRYRRLVQGPFAEKSGPGKH